MLDAQEHNGEWELNLDTNNQDLSESSDEWTSSEDWTKDEDGSEDGESDTDFSFLDDNADDGDDQKSKSAEWQIKSAYSKVMKEDDPREALNELPDYIKKWVIKMDKEKRPHVYNDKAIIDEDDIKDQVKNVMKQEAVLNAQSKKLEEVKATIPKTLSKQKQTELRKVYKENLEDGLKPHRALKDAIRETWIETEKKDWAKIPWTSNPVKRDTWGKNKYLFAKPKFLQDKRVLKKN